MMGHNAYTPAETIEIVSRAGAYKGNMRVDKVFLSGVSAGAMLACAAGTALTANSSPWYQDNAPGLIKTIAALYFPYGLVLIILTGADLCTGSFMYTATAVLHGRLSLPKMLLHWVLTTFGNLAGSLFMVAIIFGYGGVFDNATYKAEVIKYATTKQVTPDWHMIFLRAIGCNWLVCLACFIGMSGRELVSKIIGMWFPIFAFVSLGFDHVVANMMFIPMAIWLGAPEITVGLYIWKGFIPALLGNIIGGALFCSCYYFYFYQIGNEPLVIDGVEYRDVPSNITNYSKGSFVRPRKTHVENGYGDSES